MVDYIADYLENIRDRRVFPDVKPGYMKALVPDSAPEDGEKWETIFKDVEGVIMPGVSTKRFQQIAYQYMIIIVQDLGFRPGIQIKVKVFISHSKIIKRADKNWAQSQKIKGLSQIHQIVSLIKIVFIRIQLIFDIHNYFENEKFTMFDDFLDNFGRINERI